MAKQKLQEIPQFVNKEQLSDFFKISTRQIERWESEGLPVDRSGKKNIYELYEVFMWRFASIKEKSMTELDLEKLRETRAKADIKELEAEEKAGNLLPIDLILMGWQSVYSSVKTAFRGLVSDLKVNNPTIKQTDLDFIKKRVNEILTGISNENPIPRKLRKDIDAYIENLDTSTGSESESVG